MSRKLLYRRSGGLSHMTKRASHMTNGVGLPVPGVTTGATGRRSFSEAEKRRIVDEASQLGASVAMVARRYRRAAAWPMPSVIPSLAGQPSAGSSTTAASSSIPTRWSAPSGRLR